MSNLQQNPNLVEVAVAVLQRPDGSFLMAQRPQGKAYKGFWEFPGGKVEPGETPLHALVRELHEELGIEVQTAYHWLTRVFTYPHATVCLNFFRVTSWQGEPHGREGQLLSWQRLPELSVAPILPANDPIMRALQLPHLYAISNASELGAEVFIQRLQLALNNGLRLLQIREKGWSRQKLKELALRSIELAHTAGADVLLNEDIGLALEVGANGVQLTGAQLAACKKRPDVELCAASCHSAEELKLAEDLELDFALLSPVLPTKSHPGAPQLGWETFAKLAGNSAIPVYALGGLQPGDMETAWEKGAHGIALLRQAWC
jgi:8-oxo-dGTP diphosphatase